jgi:hypothetical protein
MKYERIPEVVTAVQWTGDNAEEVASTIQRKVDVSGKWLVIWEENPKRQHYVSLNDWLVLHPDSTKEYMPAWQFHAKYRPQKTFFQEKP